MGICWHGTSRSNYAVVNLSSTIISRPPNSTQTLLILTSQPDSVCASTSSLDLKSHPKQKQMICQHSKMQNAATCQASRHAFTSRHIKCAAFSSSSSRRQRVVQVMAQANRVPASAAEQLLGDGYTYADVRTPQEFAAGHPVGSLNIPFMLSTPEGMKPNPEFLAKWKETFPDVSAPIVVGCKSGNRSARACAVLVEESYSNLVDNAGGYDGWVADGLPVEV